MAIIPVASIPRKKVNARELLAELCFYYPQYTLAAARRLPAKDVMLLLKMARKKKAEEYFNLTQIAAAPHTKKGSGVKRLSSRYAKVAKDG
jgi:hypothetical protein